MINSISKNLPNLLLKYYQGMIAILMLHRVEYIDLDKLRSNENLKVAPEFLEGIIIELLDNGYEFISLDEVYDILKGGYKVRKKIAITLDDGYKDNYYQAYPIFKKYNVPFCVYVTSSFPQREAILWWYAIEDLILKNDVIELSDGHRFWSRTRTEKEQCFLKIRDLLLNLNQREFRDRLFRLFEHYKIDWFAKNSLCLDWEEIKALSKDELCTIGGHTVNHFALSRLPLTELYREIDEANQMISNHTKKAVHHFAYPFGGGAECGEREFGVVRELGLKTGVTTRRGTVYREHVNHLECLPRIMLTESFKLRDLGMIRKRRIVTS